MVIRRPTRFGRPADCQSAIRQVANLRYEKALRRLKVAQRLHRSLSGAGFAGLFSSSRPNFSSLSDGTLVLGCDCMSAGETIREVVRIVTTSSPAKEVMAPLQTKLTLLQEQVAALEAENSALRNDNRDLKTENDKLKTQLRTARSPDDELSRKTEAILKATFDREGEFSVQDITNLFHMKQSVADYHLDELRKRKLIKTHGTGFMGTGFMGSTPTYIITPAGREYVLKNLPGR